MDYFNALLSIQLLQTLKRNQSQFIITTIGIVLPGIDRFASKYDTIRYSSDLNSCASFSFFLVPLPLEPSYILVFNPVTNPCDNISPLGLLSYSTPKPLSLLAKIFATFPKHSLPTFDLSVKGFNVPQRNSSFRIPM